MEIVNIRQTVIKAGSRLSTATVQLVDGATVYTDTTVNWSMQTSFVPKSGDIIVYSDKDIIVEDGVTKNVPGFKVGDGNAYVVDLPFTDAAIVERLLEHISDAEAHVTAQERQFWNNKLNLSLEGERLEFTRL